MCILLRLCLGILAAATAWLPTTASATDVDLELVLAVDVSLSMDLGEQRLQREGYVEALRDPAVREAIRSGRHRRIALTYFEWAGPGTEKVIMPWTLIDGDAALDRFADTLEAQPISRARMTSISNALDVADRILRSSSFRTPRRVIDVSGDGPNNSGRLVVDARDELVRQGVVINGLPIILKSGGSFGYFDMDKLDRYYESCVIGGTGAFVVAVRDKAEFAPAIRRKLILEISGLASAPRIVPAQATGGGPGPPAGTDAIDCEIGERMRQRYMDGVFR